MNSLVSAIILITALAHVLLLIYIQTRRTSMRVGKRWLSITVFLSLLASATYFLPREAQIAGRLANGFALVLALVALLVAYGVVVIRDVFKRQLRFWPVIGTLWLALIAVAALLTPDASIGQPEWLVSAFTQPDAPTLLTLGGMALASLFLIGITFYAFYIALLPEVANRALFWVLNTATVLLSVLLAISGTEAWLAVSAITLFISMTGATYSQVSYRVFDIRGGMTSAGRTLLFIIVTLLVIFGTLYAFDRLPRSSPNDELLIMGILALIAASVYVLGGQVIGSLLRLFLPSVTNPTRAARRYSQQVSKAVELDQLVEVATETLNSVMGTRRSGLILVNDTRLNNDRVELLVMRSPALSDIKDPKGYVSKKGPIYQRLAAEQVPISQFDIEFSPGFAALDAAERQFFRSLNMSAYAPIIVETVVIGILMCGAKINDAPYYARDLELLATMADQTGVALRNARLVADLRHLNASMKALNDGLEEANSQLEKLDSVKTDFITIASHELRTPLAQIRGYTDIIDALNEQGMLDKDQIAGMVANLRKAIERTEELITAMLDVSQLDVNAMDLRFAQIAPESIVRMAIEPLTDAIRQRKLTLSARGLRGLPTIQGDMQRLVQAIRNIVVNAIKFTPDGGRIDITASFQPAQEVNEVDHILIAISDTGVGIDKNNLELIFEKFYRAYDPGLHSTGTYKFMGAGPGLGLTIARGVIESHGGQIWAESSGHNMETFPGTTFYIILPVHPPEDAKRVAIEDHIGSGEPTLMRT